MSIDLNILIEEKTLLQKEFDDMSKKMKTVEIDLIQMKANLNAINGAIQQTKKFIEMAQNKVKEGNNKK